MGSRRCPVLALARAEAVEQFLVGLFRSGSTVLERMLGGHPAVAEGGESMGFVAALRLAADHRGRGLIHDVVDILDSTDVTDPSDNTRKERWLRVKARDTPLPRRQLAHAVLEQLTAALEFERQLAS